MFRYASIFIVVFAISLELTFARTSNQLKVKLDHGGILVGRHLTSRYGQSIRAFMGVPYAMPPLNDLRFRPPVPFGMWLGERLAIKDSPKCIQRDPFRRDNEIEGSEDCLYLNVYVPEQTTPIAPLPVMVWFHGGAFECGSGISSFYGPKYFMDKNVILVSVNYRLGPLGFLSTESLDCPGNFGLKDQNLALKWVQQNVAAFGGNPMSVTIFGESAGGASVTYHMLSEKSKGLFHKAIAQSGTFFNPWAQPAHVGVAAERAKKMAEMVGCTTNSSNWQKILTCLRVKPAAAIAATFYELFTWDTDPMIPFPPVVEEEHEDAFLTVLPRRQQTEHFNNLPLMIGFTSDEGLLRTAGVVNTPQLLADYKQNFDKALPIILNYDHLKTAKQAEITQAIKDFYLKDGMNFDKENHQNFTDIISDGWFISGIDELIRGRLADKNSGDTFVYIFEHKGEASLTEIFHGGEKFYGTCHADELMYLFPVAEELFISSAPTQADREVSDTILELWVNFATTSNPTPKNSKLPKWTPAKSYPPDYLLIGKGNSGERGAVLTNRNDQYPLARINLWQTIQPFIPADSQQNQHQEL